MRSAWSARASTLIVGSVPLRNWAAANCILRSIGVLSKPTKKTNSNTWHVLSSHQVVRSRRSEISVVGVERQFQSLSLLPLCKTCGMNQHGFAGAADPWIGGANLCRRIGPRPGSPCSLRQTLTARRTGLMRVADHDQCL